MLLVISRRNLFPIRIWAPARRHREQKKSSTKLESNRPESSWRLMNNPFIRQEQTLPSRTSKRREAGRSKTSQNKTKTRKIKTKQTRVKSKQNAHLDGYTKYMMNNHPLHTKRERLLNNYKERGADHHTTSTQTPINWEEIPWRMTFACWHAKHESKASHIIHHPHFLLSVTRSSALRNNLA